MPVIECTCGMVMSVPSRAARASCIRCGGVEFHLLKQSEFRRQREPVMFESSSGMLPYPVASRGDVEFAMSVTSVASA